MAGPSGLCKRKLSYVNDMLNSSIDECESISEADIYVGTFYWTIKGCGYLNDQFITSGKFFTHNVKKPKEALLPIVWHLKFYPRGSGGRTYEGSRPLLSVVCELKDGCEKPFASFSVSATVSIGRNRDGRELVDEKESMFNTLKYNAGNNSVKLLDLFSYETALKDPELRVLLEEQFIITVKVKHSGGSAVTMGHACANNIPDDSLASDLFDAYNEEELTDAEIVIGEDRIKVHKLVLSVKSEVFKNLFNGQFKEAVTNEIHIDDMKYSTCERMIDYIYGRPLSCYLLNPSVEKLLHAAEKYQLEGLKARCCKILCSRLSDSCAAHLLVVSDMYNAPALKMCCENYIVNHLQDVMKSKGWSVLAEDYPHLIP